MGKDVIVTIARTQLLESPSIVLQRKKVARGAEGVLEGPSKITIEKLFPDGATAKFPLPYTLPTWFTERNPTSVTDESPSRRYHLCRRRRKLRARMDRIKDYTDDVDGDWKRLEKIKEKEQELDDANFISQLLNNAEKEPDTRALSGFSPFIISKFKQEEKQEVIHLSQYIFF
jgi:hypothetical protein